MKTHSHLPMKNADHSQLITIHIMWWEWCLMNLGVFHLFNYLTQKKRLSCKCSKNSDWVGNMSCHPPPIILRSSLLKRKMGNFESFMTCNHWIEWQSTTQVYPHVSTTWLKISKDMQSISLRTWKPDTTQYCLLNNIATWPHFMHMTTDLWD